MSSPVRIKTHTPSDARCHTHNHQAPEGAHMFPSVECIVGPTKCIQATLCVGRGLANWWCAPCARYCADMLRIHCLHCTWMALIMISICNMINILTHHCHIHAANENDVHIGPNDHLLLDMFTNYWIHVHVPTLSSHITSDTIIASTVKYTYFAPPNRNKYHHDDQWT